MSKDRRWPHIVVIKQWSGAGMKFHAAMIILSISLSLFRFLYLSLILSFSLSLFHSHTHYSTHDASVGWKHEQKIDSYVKDSQVD
jgi:hypothetical protein